MSSSSLHRESSSAAAQPSPWAGSLNLAVSRHKVFALRWSWKVHGVMGFLPISQDCSFRGMREWRGAAGMCPQPVSAMTSLSSAEGEAHCSPTCLVMAEAWAEVPDADTGHLAGAAGFAACGLALLGARRASCALFVHLTHCKPLFPSEL